VLDSSKGVPDRGGCAVGHGEGFVFDVDKPAGLFFGGGPYFLQVGSCG
jgi:hypothetical protein